MVGDIFADPYQRIGHHLAPEIAVREQGLRMSTAAALSNGRFSGSLSVAPGRTVKNGPFDPSTLMEWGGVLTVARGASRPWAATIAKTASTARRAKYPPELLDSSLIVPLHLLNVWLTPAPVAVRRHRGTDLSTFGFRP